MSFLKELKEDLGQAMNELISDEAVDNEATEAVNTVSDDTEVNTLDFDLDTIGDMLKGEAAENETAEDNVADENDVEAEVANEMDSAMLEEIMNELDEDDEQEEEVAEENAEASKEDEVPSDEVTEITKGTVIEGNITSNGSLNVYGKIKGNVSCKGKLMIAGIVSGESSAKEIFVNNAKIEGDITSEGTIKIANGSVIIGNVYATSAVVAGAVKGDIDVHGPVIVDGTAVVKGDIKSRAVQINNGAAIEGFCSQCYADIDYKALFDETFGK